jgi:magnesium chelatase family protein
MRRADIPELAPAMMKALDVTKIYSVSGNLSSDQPLISQRPFRAPHHTTSHAGLVVSKLPPHPSLCTCMVAAIPHSPRLRDC